MITVAIAHQQADAFIAEEFAKPATTKPCCKAGCFACCSESVYASEAEVAYIVESLAPEQIAELQPKLGEWLFKTRALRAIRFPEAMAYRALNLPCVFLKNGLCSIYERRPLGCRVWFAFSNPENCQLPFRRHQKYAYFSSALFHRMGIPASVNGRLVLDHLGVVLAENLRGVKIPSASRDDVDASLLKFPTK